MKKSGMSCDIWSRSDSLSVELTHVKEHFENRFQPTTNIVCIWRCIPHLIQCLIFFFARPKITIANTQYEKWMNKRERAEYEAEGEKERERHVKNVGQQLVGKLQYILGHNLKKHKDLFISCV